MVKSIHAKLSRSLWLLISFIALCCLVACGGGKDTSSDTGSNTTTTDNSSITLTSTSNSVSYGNTITATATLRDSNGSLVSGAVVTFTATGSLVAFTPVAATALTDGNGQATIQLSPTSAEGGAVSVTASATVTVSGTDKMDGSPF